MFELRSFCVSSPGCRVQPDTCKGRCTVHRLSGHLALKPPFSWRNLDPAGPCFPRESGQGSPKPVCTTEVRVIDRSERGGAARTSTRVWATPAAGRVNVRHMLQPLSSWHPPSMPSLLRAAAHRSQQAALQLRSIQNGGLTRCHPGLATRTCRQVQPFRNKVVPWRCLSIDSRSELRGTYSSLIPSLAPGRVW